MSVANTALMEAFLFVIMGLLSLIGWMLRKYTKQILNRIDNLTQTQQRHADQLETNTAILVGEDSVSWDGAVEEIKKNRRSVTIAHERLDRHERSLKRADLLADEYEYSLPDDLDTDRGNKWT